MNAKPNAFPSRAVPQAPRHTAADTRAAWTPIARRLVSLVRIPLSPVPRSPVPLLLVPLLLAACASEPQSVGGPSAPSGQPMIANPPAAAETARSAEPTGPRYRGPWEDPNNPLYHRTIYFDYDSAEVKPQ